MKESRIQFTVQTFPDATQLEVEDARLLAEARKAVASAYAPYSRFKVGAAARMADGRVVCGSNQENASFPAGLCAERVALSAASAAYPGIVVREMAISYLNEMGSSDHPISPCGICRQTLAEYEARFGQPIRLILGGVSGEIFIIQKATDLLPLAFSKQELKP